MGLTHVAIDVANVANPDVVETVELLVDSGATYSVVPGDILDRLGISPLAEQVFRLADGRKYRSSQGSGRVPGR